MCQSLDIFANVLLVHFFMLLVIFRTRFQDDFRLMCNNAMTYNHQDTIYYKAARKLLHYGTKLLSPEKLRPLRSVLPFMAEITAEQVGFDFGPEEESEQDIVEEEAENEPTLDKIKIKDPKEMPK